MGDLDIFRGLLRGEKLLQSSGERTPHFTAKLALVAWALVRWPEGINTGKLVTLLRRAVSESCPQRHKSE